MKFKVHRTSNFGSYQDLEINSLSALLRFVDSSNEEVIISKGDKVAGSYVLEIYDDWRE